MDKIKDLQAKQGKVILEAQVVEVGSSREFTKFGKSGRVAKATIEDDTGKIKLTLWNDEIDKVKAGVKIKIQNGYVNEWQGEKQITAGRFGSIDLLS